MKTQFDDEWKRWIEHNISRGCSKDELFRILADEGFDFHAIQRELNHTPSLALTAIPNPLRQKPPAPSPHLHRYQSPLVELYLLENFLDAGNCAALIRLIAANLRPSTISAAGIPDREFRTSRTCDLDERYPIVNNLNRKICAAMQNSPSRAEITQGQYYDINQEFKPHTDYFESYELERFSTPTLGQRTWTFMVYLNKPDIGGETKFLNFGLVVRPRVGLAVIWNNLLPDGRPNPDTIHQGMPVIAGYKAIITKWFRSPLI